jgi:hypothetical protein
MPWDYDPSVARSIKRTTYADGWTLTYSTLARRLELDGPGAMHIMLHHFDPARMLLGETRESRRVTRWWNYPLNDTAALTLRCIVGVVSETVRTLSIDPRDDGPWVAKAAMSFVSWPVPADLAEDLLGLAQWLPAQGWARHQPQAIEPD